MEEVPINPDEVKQETTINLPKKLWESVDTPKPAQEVPALSELPLDYEADDAQPEDLPQEGVEMLGVGAVSAGSVLAERYLKPLSESEPKKLSEQQEVEVQLDRTAQTFPEMPMPSPELTPNDLPETYFERRHEIKDEPSQTTTGQANIVADHDVGAVATSAIVEEDTSLYTEEQHAFSSPFNGLSALTKGTYGQAIKGGFWAGIAIAIIIMVISIVS